MPQCTYGAQRATWESWFPPSTLWVSRPSALAAGTFTSQLAAPVGIFLVSFWYELILFMGANLFMGASEAIAKIIGVCHHTWLI